MEMPKLIPLPIKTKNKAVFARLWAWMTEVRKWQVAENWEFELDKGIYHLEQDIRIVIPKGFEFDGASIPRPLWAILSPTGLLLIPGLIHDFGYRYDYLWTPDETEPGQYIKLYEGEGQAFWDRLFFKVGQEVNGMRVINALAWLPLATLGFLAWNDNRKKNAEDIYPQ